MAIEYIDDVYVYQTEDKTDGLFYRFIPNVNNNLVKCSFNLECPTLLATLLTTHITSMSL